MNVEHLILLGRLYSSHTGLRLSTLGAYSVNDGKFFLRLAEGGGCTLKTAARIIQWFSDHWPSDLEWPRDIARPTASKREAA